MKGTSNSRSVVRRQIQTKRGGAIQTGWRLSGIVRQKVIFYGQILRDPRTPWLSRVLLGMALGYLLMPIDLVPDWIPVLGIVDDALVVPGLVWLALRFVPREVVADHRERLRVSEAG